MHFMKVLLFLQIVVSKGPCRLEYTLDVYFLVQFGLHQNIIVNTLEFLLNSDQFVLITGVQLLIGLEKTQSSLVLINYDSLGVPTIGGYQMIFPYDTGDGACSDFNDVFVAGFVLLLKKVAERFLDLLVGPLNGAFNHINSFLFLQLWQFLAQMGVQVGIYKFVDLFGRVFGKRISPMTVKNTHTLCIN